MERVVRIHQDASYFLFLGDGIRDFNNIFQSLALPHVAVKGNCDIGCGKEATTSTLQMGGCSLFMTHGHLYGVKYTLSDLLLAGREAGADLILFGHTHQPLCRYFPAEGEKKAIYLLNPGSISLPPFGLSCSYGVVEIKNRLDGGWELLTNVVQLP
jgi:hypothetical protein